MSSNGLTESWVGVGANQGSGGCWQGHVMPGFPESSPNQVL